VEGFALDALAVGEVPARVAGPARPVRGEAGPDNLRTHHGPGRHPHRDPTPVGQRPPYSAEGRPEMEIMT